MLLCFLKPLEDKIISKPNGNLAYLNKELPFLCQANSNQMVPHILEW